MNTLQLWIKEHLREGELYAGVILAKGDQPAHHLVLLSGAAVDVNWKDAKTFAEKAGGDLPTRREQALLFANLKEEFQQRWYWSSEQHAALSVCAWSQDFDDGGQDDVRKSYQGRARAVRRLIIL
jgi:hypothetical protein